MTRRTTAVEGTGGGRRAQSERGAKVERGTPPGRGRRRPPRRAAGDGRSLDLEAVGLVLLAFGLALAALLAPAVPTGDLGHQVRAALVGRAGVGAWALPWPPIVLGALFLLRRSPSAWPRVLLGYALAIVGVWGFVMLLAPPAAGWWGVSLRASLTGAAGALAAVPAFLFLTLGIEAIAAWRPTRIVQGLVRRVLRLIALAVHGTLAWRVRARERAAFLADVAQLRTALIELDRDLAALESLYKTSEELARWRQSVRASVRALRRATPEALQDGRADAEAWAAAVRDFTRDRAEELGARLREEGAHPPLPGDGGRPDGGFEGWWRVMKTELDESIDAPHAVGRGLDRVRSALVLDLTALADRHRRLARERDLSERALVRMSPRELAKASQAHAERLTAYRTVEEHGAALAGAAVALDAWRSVADALTRALADHPDAEELLAFDRSLAETLRTRGRDELGALESWADALEAAALRAREDELLRARRAAEELAAREASARDAAAREAAAREAGERDAARAASADAAAASGHAAAPAGDLGTDAAAPPGALASAEAPPTGGAGHGREAMAPDLVAALLGEEQVHVGDRAAWVTGERMVPQELAAAGGRAVAAGSSGPVAGQRPAGGTRPLFGDVPPFEPTSAASVGARVHADDATPGKVGGIPLQVPLTDLLDPPEASREDPVALAREVKERVAKIDVTLSNFKLEGRVASSVRGPSVTRFEVEPAPGEKISRFANLSDDLALAMAVGSVRIEAPIPGKSVIGLEVPNANRDLIRFREAVESPSFRRAKARLPLILGKSIDGEMMVGDLARMPHLLIAGSTGSGKSVAVNTLIGSLLFRFLPTELRFLMIDPKMVELTPFDGVPHLIRPVVTNPSDASGVLLGAVAHMERRYKMMSKIGAKNLDQYNAKARNLDLPELPFIVIVIDELADLMITSPKEVESAIMRLAQMARATGMHLILATQRPSVDILTSLIKVNVPARLAFAVSSGFDSRTILDSMGAERLIGLGDALFYQPGLVKPVRIQGPFVSEGEIANVAGFLRRQFFEDEFVEAYGDDFEPASADDSDASGFVDWNDDKLRQAAELVVTEGQASVSRLQRRLQVGHARAGKLMDSLESLGVVGPHSGSKPREVLVTIDALPDVFGR